jgi:hypothetical protein
LFIVQWIKHAQTNPSLHALSYFSPNLFMCVARGIQVHKLFSFGFTKYLKHLKVVAFPILL